jgi:hypothetical protein
MQRQHSATDPRYFQVLFQVLFLSYGLFFLHWQQEWLHYAISIGGCLFFNYSFESIKQKSILPLAGSDGFQRWGFSALISAMSLCLLLKTAHWSISLLAALLTVGSKYFFRYQHKHVFNPSAFGIVATIITGQAWLSPAQWGSSAVIFFFVVTLGTIVVTRVQKLDVSLAFLFTYVGLLYWRQVGYLGWPADHFIHSISTGSLLLFSFFMISDPKTSPDHPFARMVWAVLIAAGSFYLSVFKWQYNTAIWVLVIAAPLVPLLDRIFKAQRFDWNQQPCSSPLLKHFSFSPLSKRIVAAVCLVTFITYEAVAFCGFYVSKADGTLRNKTSQVIVVRDGDRNVITMYNDFKGDTKDFAMVVPVPSVLQKKDIRVVDQQIFKTLNEYSQPRLVEYFDQNPCNRVQYETVMDSGAALGQATSVAPTAALQRREKVKIEARYLVGEYDILILSAEESTALKTWLDENGYKIPKGANEVLEPYIKSNLKFFVVKVNEEEKKRLGNNFLRPIQITFNSPKFMLPIRLGMANADSDQDMIVYGFSKKGRIECTNYRTVTVPTGKNIPLFVKKNFSAFYTNLFQHQWQREGKSVALLEYAWDVSPRNFLKCDPCVATAPSQQDLVQAGVWWMNPSEVRESDVYNGNVFFTRMHIRYNRASFPQDLQFQITPNTDNYQARYIVTHPATGDFDCPAGKEYVNDLKQRRQNEMEMLEYLTGKNYKDWDLAATEETTVPAEASYTAAAETKPSESKQPIYIAAIGAGLLLLIGWQRKNRT